MISTKKESLSTLVHKLDRLVSEVVRRTAADYGGTCECISCDGKWNWTQMDCAHFIDRGNMNTRFNLKNLAPSCKQCNRYNEDEHKAKWAEKLGPEMVSYLESEGRSMRKLMRYELEKGIELMEAKLKSLR
jgi:5-methylcytosine-specific restriction endonuclease McrA